MDKFLITFKSGNRITGPIMITTSPRASCPVACPFRKDGDSPEAGVCYAEHGHLGHYIWNGLDRTPAGQKISNRIPVYSFDDLLNVVRSQPVGTLWRHNKNRVTIDRERLRRLTAANTGRRGFTYTHYPVADNAANHSAGNGSCTLDCHGEHHDAKGPKDRHLPGSYSTEHYLCDMRSLCSPERLHRCVSSSGSSKGENMATYWYGSRKITGKRKAINAVRKSARRKTARAFKICKIRRRKS